MLSDQWRRVWREQPVRDSRARNRNADIRRAKPRVQFGIAGLADDTTFGDVGGGKDKAANQRRISPREGQRHNATPGTANQSGKSFDSKCAQKGLQGLCVVANARIMPWDRRAASEAWSVPGNHVKIPGQSGELGTVSCRTGAQSVKHQHGGIALVSGGAIFDQPSTVGMDRRLDSDLRMLTQVLREKVTVERRQLSHL